MKQETNKPPSQKNFSSVQKEAYSSLTEDELVDIISGRTKGKFLFEFSSIDKTTKAQSTKKHYATKDLAMNELMARNWQALGYESRKEAYRDSSKLVEAQHRPFIVLILESAFMFFIGWLRGVSRQAHLVPDKSGISSKRFTIYFIASVIICGLLSIGKGVKTYLWYVFLSYFIIFILDYLVYNRHAWTRFYKRQLRLLQEAKDKHATTT